MRAEKSGVAGRDELAKPVGGEKIAEVPPFPGPIMKMEPTGKS
jgi:hypothetical protein